jgi:hypothetical protein
VKTITKAEFFPPSIHTADIYGKGLLTAPEGYEFTGEFRPSNLGEFYLRREKDVYTYKQSYVGLGSGPTPEPRLILKKVEEIKPAQIKKAYLYRFLRVGRPRPNVEEYARIDLNYWVKDSPNNTWTKDFDIYERIEI